jgi:hypothetical protein
MSPIAKRLLDQNPSTQATSFWQLFDIAHVQELKYTSSNTLNLDTWIMDNL